MQVLHKMSEGIGRFIIQNVVQFHFFPRTLLSSKTFKGFDSFVLNLLGVFLRLSYFPGIFSKCCVYHQFLGSCVLNTILVIAIQSSMLCF